MALEGAVYEGTGWGEIKTRFLEQQIWVDNKLREIQQSDPVLADSEPEPEIGTESWKSTTHAEMEVERQGLLRLQKDAQEVINLMESGSFGKCKVCLGDVEGARLRFAVTATKCASCAASASV